MDTQHLRLPYIPGAALDQWLALEGAPFILLICRIPVGASPGAS